jgi:SAM-dependent methyltransferase
VRWGSLRRLEPVSSRWGSERGTPVDRYYIERFFEQHRSLISGRVLEVRDPRYTTRFGHDVACVDIVDIDPRNDEATIVADLADPGSLPVDAFDCAIVPQTLMFVRDLDAAVTNLWASLRPGGALLVTNPAISRIAFDAPDVDRWHLTEPSLRELMDRCCVGGEIEIGSHGNPVVAVAFLHGITQEELRPEELEARHALFPIVVTAVARKPR